MINFVPELTVQWIPTPSPATATPPTTTVPGAAKTGPRQTKTGPVASKDNLTRRGYKRYLIKR